MSLAHHESAVDPDGRDLFRLVVDAEPEANLLLRLLEPFVIHDVLPSRVDCAVTDGHLAVELEFAADPAVAVRLHQRLAVMVGVRDVALAPAGRARASGSLAA